MWGSRKLRVAVCGRQFTVRMREAGAGTRQAGDKAFVTAKVYPACLAPTPLRFQRAAQFTGRDRCVSNSERNLGLCYLPLRAL
jgi:hypothetical protein